MWFTVVILATIVLAAFVQSSTGFGFAIIIMSVWPLFLPVLEATQLMMFASGVVILLITWKFRQYINFRVILIPVLVGTLGNVIGTVALVQVSNTIAVKVVGVLLLLLSVYFFVLEDKIRIPQNFATASVAGVVSGLMGGFLNLPGPAIVLYCTGVTRNKQEYLGTVQFYFLVLIVIKFAVLWIVRGFSHYVLIHVPLVIIASLIGMALGLKLFHQITAASVKKVVLILMAVSGVWYVIR